MNFGFVQINEKPQAGFDRIVFRRKIGAVERIAHLQAQACRARRGRTAECPASFPFSSTSFQTIAASFAGKENFHAVFAGVAGARDREFHCR